MEIVQDREGGAAIVSPAGRLDSAAAPRLQQALVALDAAGERRIVLDLARLEYISSAGLSVLFWIAKRMREVDGALALCSLGDQVRRVFELAGFMPHFTIAATRDEALARINGSR
jgi:stage II sporulation protein AA (anti-sigma F factor antagonist)